MSACKEIQQRVYISDLLDETEQLQVVKLTLDEVAWDDGRVECQDEFFELNGEYVTFIELALQFGKAKIESFIDDAMQNAR